MAFTSYVVDNDRRFRDAIARAQSSVSDLRIPFGSILADFYRSEQAIFKLSGPGQYPPFKGSGGYWRTKRSGKNPGERVWQGNKDGVASAYQARKKRIKGFDYPLLVFSGSLAASLLSPQAAGAIAEIGQGSLTIGTSIKYGIYHQSDAPRTKIPLRKFLFIGPEAPQFATSDQMGRAERWLNIMNDFVLAKGRQSGAFQ